MSKLKRIIIHHTGGQYKPNHIDLHSYHYLIDDNGLLYKGDFNPQDNEDVSDDYYCKHTKNGNTGSIGIACCGNKDYSISNRLGSTKYPLTNYQLEKLYSTVANLCLTFGIYPKPYTVLTHYEFNQIYNINTGKTDITFLPTVPNIKVDDVGNFIRSKVLWYYNKFKNERSY